jgi:hypothetical protein
MRHTILDLCNAILACNATSLDVRSRAEALRSHLMFDAFITGTWH